MKLRRSFLVALMTVPLVMASAFASPLAHGEEYVRPIKYLGPELPPLNFVTPADIPVPASVTGIGPGSPLVITRTDGAVGCTANFIWTSTQTTTTKKGNGKGKGSSKKSTTTTTTKTYLGAAGHCFLPGGATPLDSSDDKVSTHGPDADYNPALSSASVCVDNCDFGGLSGQFLDGDYVQLGPVVYARQSRAGDQVGEDFGIVEIQPENASLIRSALPVWGGPTGVENVSVGGGVCVYGNAIVFGEHFITKARTGVGRGLSEDERSWVASLPSAQGDSGSGLVTCGASADGFDGRGAAGILTHISVSLQGPTIVGTTTGQAVRMTLHDAGIPLQLRLANDTLVSPEPTPEYPPPPPPPPTPTPDGTIGVGQEYTWDAGPFTRAAPPEAMVFGETCDNVQDADDHCDYEFVQLDVPTGGAQLTVRIESEDPTADFDLYVFGPDGQEVDHSANPANPEEISKLVKLAGVYTIAVNPFATVEASYAGSAKLEEPPPPPPPPPTLQGDPHIYQLGAIDPLLLTGDYFVARGELVGLSVRVLHSNDPSVQLSVDAAGNANFIGSHRIMKDGQLVYGPFETDEGTDSGGSFRTDNDWTVPPDAAPGTYVFEAFATVGGQTYQTATLQFEIL